MNSLKVILEAEEGARRILSEAEEARFEPFFILEEARRRRQELGRRAMEEVEARTRPTGRNP